jgi:acyl-CoA carboxylase subunit alpha
MHTLQSTIRNPQSAIKRLLIANRGEIARRIMRTCREMGVSTVAVFAEPDRDALFVREADEAVALGGATPAESYLRIDAIIAAAQRTAADAVHPGYGFLAENASFARACTAAGLAFVGPSAEAIAAMGSKVEAKRRMQAAGVSVLPTVEVARQSSAELSAEAQRLGFPVLVKATAGGGGRGMRVVARAEELAEAVTAAGREAQAAFGDGAVFLEPYIEAPRHVEIQIFGDAHGNLLHLFERECSIQRRHQKIIEEAPSPAVGEALRAAMGDAAVRAGREIGYVGAGTVEFLLRADGQFFFLEVNTRLQVEHPVTECVTGLDLVRLQILVAQNEPLPAEALQPSLRGHAIEARLCAEDPREGFLPTSGTLHRFEIPQAAGVRVDAGVGDGAVISPYYDSLFAKVIAHAPTRAEAARRLAAALRRAKIHGPTTNRELLVRILEHEEFLAGQIDTHFLQRHDPATWSAPLVGRPDQRLYAAAAALAGQAHRRGGATVLHSIPSGWRNNASQLQRTKFVCGTNDGHSASIGADSIDIGYAFERGSLKLQIDDQDIAAARVGACTPDFVQLEIDGVQRTYEVARVLDTHYVDGPLGPSRLCEVPRFVAPADEVRAGSLVAPLPGVINEIRVRVGDAVAAGDVLLVIESMKSFYPVTAPTAGRVAAVRVEVSQHVAARGLLVVIEEE